GMKATFIKEHFNFTSYKRLSTEKVMLRQKKGTDISLPGNKKGTLKLEGIQSGEATVAATVENLTTTYTLGREGSVFINAGYLALNPTRTVPMLELEEGGRIHRLSQSLAIIEFLEERYPSPPLFPKDPFDRAFARQLAEIVNSGIQPLQNRVVTLHLKDVLK